MSDELKTIKFQLMLSESEAKAIDDWGFKNRIRTRAEAIRRLCKLALILDERMEELFQFRLRSISELVRLGEMIEYKPSEQTPHHISNAWSSMQATATLHKIVMGKNTSEENSSPSNTTEAFECALIEVNDLSGRVKELSDAIQELRSPSKIEETFASVDLNTELWNRMLGRPSDFENLSLNELLEIIPKKHGTSFKRENES